MNRIFISYRSSDGSKDAARLAHDLGRIFGDDQVFFDKHDLRGGSSWRQEIMKALHGRPVVLPVLTPEFFGAMDGGGQRRIDQPDDPVRQELEASLQAGVTLIPLLTDNVTPPTTSQLPASLQSLPERHALKLRTGDWSHDVARLTEDLRALGVKPLAPPPDTQQQDTGKLVLTRKPWAGMLLAVFALLVVLELGVAGADSDAETYQGAAFLGLFPLGMAWLARRWTLTEPSRWPRWGATALLVISVWNVLVFLGKGVETPTATQAQAGSSQTPGQAPLPLAAPTAPAPVTSLAGTSPQAQAPTVDPGQAIDNQPTSAGAPGLTGTWVAQMADGTTLPFAVRQNGDQVTMSSGKLVVATDPEAQRLVALALTQQDGRIDALRFRAQGELDGQLLELDMVLESGDGRSTIDQGALTLLIDPNQQQMSGSVHFSKGQPSLITLRRQ